VKEFGTVTSNNCIHGAPEFMNAAGGNYHLQSISPCIDKGDNSYVPIDAPQDLDGKARIVNGRVDIGAYEKQ
jgi:hypothetical protein